MNKVPEVQAVYNLPRVKSLIDMKTGGAIKTGQTYLSALVKLNECVKERGKDTESIIDYLTDRPQDVYQLLGSYISYLKKVKQGITPNTIRNYIAH